MKTEVNLYIDDKSYDTIQYGVHYVFGDDISEKCIKRLNGLCDTITFRESYRSDLQVYPDKDLIVDYGIYTRERKVLFRDVPLEFVTAAAEQIATLLGVVCGVSSS